MDGGAGTCILRITNQPVFRRPRVALAVPGFSGDIDHFVQDHAFPLEREALGEGGWTLRDTRAEAILEKVRNAGTPLEAFVMGQVRPARETGPDPAFVIDGRIRKMLIRKDLRCKALIRPVIDGAEIGRYSRQHVHHM